MDNEEVKTAEMIAEKIRDKGWPAGVVKIGDGKVPMIPPDMQVCIVLSMDNVWRVDYPSGSMAGKDFMIRDKRVVFWVNEASVRCEAKSSVDLHDPNSIELLIRAFEYCSDGRDCNGCPL